MPITLLFAVLCIIQSLTILHDIVSTVDDAPRQHAALHLSGALRRRLARDDHRASGLLRHHDN